MTPETYLVPGVTYPSEFLRVVGLGMVDIDPWAILPAQQSRSLQGTLDAAHGELGRLPFALNRSTGMLACFEPDDPSNHVVHVHPGARAGNELYRRFPSFYCWLRTAVDDLIRSDASVCATPESTGAPVLVREDDLDFTYDEHSDELYSLNGDPFTGITLDPRVGLTEMLTFVDGRIEGPARGWNAQGRLVYAAEFRYNRCVHVVRFDEHGRAVGEQ